MISGCKGDKNVLAFGLLIPSISDLLGMKSAIFPDLSISF